MAIEIVSQSYLPRKPLVVCNADSLAELSTLTNVAEGSKATVNGTEYVYENNSGWVEPGSGGGGGGGSGVFVAHVYRDYEQESGSYVCDKTYAEIATAVSDFKFAVIHFEPADDMVGTNAVWGEYIFPVYNDEPDMRAQGVVGAMNGTSMRAVFVDIIIDEQSSVSVYYNNSDTPV